MIAPDAGRGTPWRRQHQRRFDSGGQDVNTSQQAAIRNWILADSDRHAAETQRQLNNWRAGYAAGLAARADAYDEGFADGALNRKKREHDVAAIAAGDRDRWTLRGERRTAVTFAQPHPDDHPGGPVKPW